MSRTTSMKMKPCRYSTSILTSLKRACTPRTRITLGLLKISHEKVITTEVLVIHKYPIPLTGSQIWKTLIFPATWSRSLTITSTGMSTACNRCCQTRNSTRATNVRLLRTGLPCQKLKINMSFSIRNLTLKSHKKGTLPLLSIKVQRN